MEIRFTFYLKALYCIHRITVFFIHRILENYKQRIGKEENLSWRMKSENKTEKRTIVTLTHFITHFTVAATHFTVAMTTMHSHGRGRNTHSVSWPLVLPFHTVVVTTMLPPPLAFAFAIALLWWSDETIGMEWGRKKKCKLTNTKHYGADTKWGGRKKNETNETTSFHFFANSTQTRESTLTRSSLCILDQVHSGFDCAPVLTHWMPP